MYEHKFSSSGDAIIRKRPRPKHRQPYTYMPNNNFSNKSAFAGEDDWFMISFKNQKFQVE